MQTSTSAAFISLDGTVGDLASQTLIGCFSSGAVQYTWSASPYGWAPEWDLGDVGVDVSAGLGAAGDRLLLFSSSAVQARSRTNLEVVGEWSVDDTGAVKAGCGEGDGSSALLLLQEQSSSGAVTSRISRLRL